MEVAQSTNNLPVEVAQNTNNLPVEVAQNTNNLPVEVAQNTNNLPVEVAQNTNNLPVEVAQNTNSLPVEVAQDTNNLSVVVEPIEAQNNIDLPIVLEEQIGKNENQIWFITYGKELQGLVITDHEIEFPYYDIHTALLNIFLNDSHAILILEGYMMALIKQMNEFFLFDSHARDSSGMPDPNGTAVVMKFTNILELEQYLYSLSIELHTNSFEIVPVQFNIYIASKSKTKGENDREYQKKRRSVETTSEAQIRLQKVRESIKRRQSKETDSERQNRLQKENESKKRKLSEETDSERRNRLQKENESKKRKRSEETDSERRNRLEKDRLSKKQKRAQRVSQPQPELSQTDYLNLFDITQNGGIEEQCWAKANISKFNKSMQYTVIQCTVCQEAWPLKSKPQSPYVCSRCSRDKKSPQKFSYENSMIPSHVPLELQNLTQIEEMLITRALPIMRVYIKPGGQRGYSGHCINLPQNVTELAISLQRYPKDLAIIIVKVKGRDNTFRDGQCESKMCTMPYCGL